MTWIEQAACKDKPTEIFFPTSQGRGAYDLARAICTGCPVREACLEDAMSTDEWFAVFGMRGGLNPTQREKLWKARSRKVAA